MSRFGILTSIADPALSRYFVNPARVFTYLDGSHYDFASLAGAIPMVVQFDMPLDNLVSLLDQTDLLMVPGLSPSQEKSAAYQAAVNFIADYAVQRNNQPGRGPYPVLFFGGGFVPFLSSMLGDDSGANCDRLLLNKSAQVKLDPQTLKATAFFSKLNPELLNSCLASGVFFNSNCTISYQSFVSSALGQMFWPVGVTTLALQDYVAVAEHRVYPFVGMLFDPSKTLFGRVNNMPPIDRSRACTRTVADIAISIVDYARALAVAPDAVSPLFQKYFGMVDTPWIFGLPASERGYVFKRWNSLYPSK